ncbi:hypothetical protein M0804_012847 [Polistes exclamans]|nr:hypothetical protein M0804_012847 [Polistes exclamans]
MKRKAKILTETIINKRDELDEEHDKSRNKILEALGQIQSYDVNQNSYDSDSTYFSVAHVDEQVYSPVLEDLLTELNILKLEKQLCVDKNDPLNSICSYCKHIYEIPNILMKPGDNKTISPLEKCKEDFNFLQAIVWLKSILTRMHEIPLEEYNLISNVFNKVLKCDVKSRSHINDLSFSKLQGNSKKKIICNSPNTSIKKLNNTVSLNSKSYKYSYDFNGQNYKELYKEKENCTNINDTLNLSDPLTPQRWNNLCTMDKYMPPNWIIPESDDELTINSENVEDTYQENFITPDLISLENDSLNQNESNISDKQDSAYDTLNIDQDSINFFNNIDEGIRNNCLQKKRKKEIKDIPRKRLKNIKRSISTGWVNFTLKSLETNDVVIKSIEIILRAFKDQTIVKDYLKRKCWIDTLEKEALDAILKFSNIFRLEMKSDICSRIVVQAIQDVFEEICQVTNFNKMTLQIYHISIILEFCNSQYICYEIIDFLIKKLDYFNITLSDMFENRLHGIHNVINKIHLILYALSICLRKYKIIILSNKNDTEDNIIVPVIKLWRKQWKTDQVCSKNTKKEKCIEKWINSLEVFTINHIYDIPLLAEKSRQLYLMLIT